MCGAVLRRLRVEPSFRIGRIHQKGDHLGLWKELVEHFEVFAAEFAREPAHARDVCLRPVDARNQPCLDGIDTAGEQDWDRGCEPLGGQRRIVAADRGDDRDLARYQVGRQLLHPIRSIFRVAVFDREIAAFGIPGLVEALPKCFGMMRTVARCIAAEDSRSPGSTAAAHGRKRHRHGAAECCNELASSHSITSSARASSVGGTVRPSALAVLRLITSSYLVGACTGRSAGFSPFRIGRHSRPRAGIGRPDRAPRKSGRRRRRNSGRVDRGQFVPGRQRDDQIAMTCVTRPPSQSDRHCRSARKQ